MCQRRAGAAGQLIGVGKWPAGNCTDALNAAPVRGLAEAVEASPREEGSHSRSY